MACVLRREAAAFGLAGLLLFAGGLRGRAEEATIYGLLAGSTITDGCRDCDRMPIVRPLDGSFLLELDRSLLGATHYIVSDFEAMSPRGEYVAVGKGRYSVIVTAPPFRQEMELDLEVNGAKGVIAKGSGPIDAAWPVIEIEIAEDGTRDPAHQYILHIIAAPLPKKWVRYAIAKGSFFLDECTICGRLSVPLPIEGTFLLGEIESGANPIATYIVRDLYARPREAPRLYRISGGGVYRQGGEVALIQEVALRIRVNDVEGAILAGGPGPVPARLPAIEFDAHHTNPTTPVHVYTLHIAAIPEDLTGPLFRRGDGNFDGRRDIADAIYTLSHLFGQGPALCRDALDLNDDGVLDLADPIGLLNYLFAQGPAPEPPIDCGADPTPSDPLDCSKSPGC